MHDNIRRELSSIVITCLKNSVTNCLFFQGRIQQLYAVQCTGSVQQETANVQCAALPSVCTEQTQSLAASFAEFTQPATAPPPVIK